MADWSKLPVAVLWMIAVRLFSAVELKHFRCICRSWRSSVSGAYRPLSSRPLIKLNPLVVVAAFTTQGEVEEIKGLDLGAFISRASFYRVTHSSQSHGWLIKSDVDINLGTFHFINPLSRHPYHHRCQSLNLLKFTFTEIREAYVVQNSRREKPSSAFKRVILVTLEGKDHFVGVGFDGKIRYWNGEIWTRIRIKGQMAQFCDIIVFRGSIFALDSNGIVWWITSFSAIFRLEASLEENITRGMSFVECCGELYIVQRLHEENLQIRKAISMDHNAYVGAVSRVYNVIHDDVGNEVCGLPVRHCPKTIGFKVYKLNESLVKWVEVESLGNNAFMLATDTCFSVVAHNFYGCMPNAIYFNDEKEEEIKVFKLDDGSIVTILAELFPSVYPNHL